MPVQKGLWKFHNGVWVGILGDDVGPPPPPPPPPPPGVAGPPPTFFGAGGGKGGAVAILPNWPNGHAIGQAGLLIVETAAQPLGNLAGLLALGWAHAPGSPLYVGTAGAAGSVGITALWKRAASTAEPAVDVGDSGSHQVCRILVFGGCFPTGSPFDTTGNAANTNATLSTGVTLPAVNTTSDNCRIVAIAGNATDTLTTQQTSSSNASLASFATLASFQHTAGVGGGFDVLTGTKATAGIVGVTNLTIATASAQVRLTLALRPAVTGTPPPTSGFRTMIGGQGLDSSLWGTEPVSDIFQVNTSGSSIAGTGGWLDLASGGVVKVDANAAIGSTALTVEPLTLSLPASTALSFGGAKIATVTAAATVGATALTVAALPAALVINDVAKYRDACMICRITGGNDQSKNADGSFSPTLWKGQFNAWKAEVTAVTGGVAKLRAAVADGRWRALYTLDDFTLGEPQTVPPGNAYLHAVTFEEIEEICKWVKVDSPSPWPWMPLVARGPNKYLRAAAAATGAGDRINGVRQYHYLDAGWGQARPTTDPDPVVYYNKEVNDGLACALGFVGGINMLDRGRGDTPGWGCQSGGLAGKCSMSPAEIRRWGTAALANTNVHGFNIYSYNFGVTYWNLAAIQSAMQDVYDDSVGRDEGPINVRDDLEAA